MVRKVAYWATTALVAAMGAFGGFMYLTGSPEAVEGFRHVGYPQQLRILLGIAKALGAITLVAPGFPMLKEWAYAGFTYAWIAAAVAHYLAGDGGESIVPLVLLVVLAISYVTRPLNRRYGTRVTVP
jgi:hypothetical protein